MLTKNKAKALEKIIKYCECAEWGCWFTSSMVGLPYQTIGSLSKIKAISKLGTKAINTQENLYELNRKRAVEMLEGYYAKANKEKLSKNISFFVTPLMHAMLVGIAKQYKTDKSSVIRAMIDSFKDDYDIFLGVEKYSRLHNVVRKQRA